MRAAFCVKWAKDVIMRIGSGSSVCVMEARSML